ncbi:unnamed protein product [Lathyrus sativus]|nr:unnamed protein product [Lathyrus sativus]
MIKEELHLNEGTSKIAMNAPSIEGKEIIGNQHIAYNGAVTLTSLLTLTNHAASRNLSDEDNSSNAPSKRLSQENSIEEPANLTM